MRILVAGNTEVPAYLALVERGFAITCSNGMTWHATKEGDVKTPGGPPDLRSRPDGYVQNAHRSPGALLPEHDRDRVLSCHSKARVTTERGERRESALAKNASWSRQSRPRSPRELSRGQGSGYQDGHETDSLNGAARTGRGIA